MNLHTACIQRNETQSQWWTHGPNEEGAYLSASKQSEHHSSASEWINAHHAPPHGAHEHPAREQDRRRDSTRIVRCTSPASSPLPRFYIRILYHAGMAHRALRGSPCGCSAARTTPSFRPEKGRDSAHKVLSNGRSTRAFFLSSLAPSASSSRPLLALPAQSSTWTFCMFLLRYWYADSMFFFLADERVRCPIHSTTTAHTFAFSASTKLPPPAVPDPTSTEQTTQGSIRDTELDLNSPSPSLRPSSEEILPSDLGAVRRWH